MSQIPPTPHVPSTKPIGTRQPYNFSQNVSVTPGANHFMGDSTYSVNHPNALCVTSRPNSILSDKCQMAYDEHTNGTSTCAWTGNFMASVYSDNLPGNNPPKQCSQESDPNNVCVPDGTIPLLCMGQRINTEASVAPSWIAVPRSEAIQDLTGGGHHGCHGPNHNTPTNGPHDYVKTSNMPKGSYKNVTH